MAHYIPGVWEDVLAAQCCIAQRTKAWVDEYSCREKTEINIKELYLWGVALKAVVNNLSRKGEFAVAELTFVEGDMLPGPVNPNEGCSGVLNINNLSFPIAYIGNATITAQMFAIAFNAAIPPQYQPYAMAIHNGDNTVTLKIHPYYDTNINLWTITYVNNSTCLNTYDPPIQQFEVQVTAQFSGGVEPFSIIENTLQVADTERLLAYVKKNCCNCDVENILPNEYINVNVPCGC